MEGNEKFSSNLWIGSREIESRRAEWPSERSGVVEDSPGFDLFPKGKSSFLTEKEEEVMEKAE